MDIQKIRESRSKGVVIFSKFSQEKKHYGDCLFCFFEGEDNKYYSSRIELYSKYNYTNTINYNCGGRNEVMKAYMLICGKEEYDAVNKMFFIDRDFSPLCKKARDIYQTPCYSIENFYTSKNAFERIINREFGINSIEDDYCKCASDYERRQNEFHCATLFLNVWISCQRMAEEKNKMKKMGVSIAPCKWDKSPNGF